MMIKINGLPVQVLTFPGGEVNPRLPEGLKAPMEIIARLESSDDIMVLILVCDSLRRHYGAKVAIDLVIPYYPYARQDRVCNSGEALSKEVINKLITSMCQCNFTTFDVHSDTDKVKNISVLNIARRLSPKFSDDTVLVAPDAGSTEKVKGLAGHFGLDWIQGVKHRDLETGALSGFGIESCEHKFDWSTKHLLIVDDICDGGGTFNGLASVIKKTLGPKTLSLYVTHGIFSRGFHALEDNFDHIYTTDTLNKEWLAREKLTVLKVVES